MVWPTLDLKVEMWRSAFKSSDIFSIVAFMHIERENAPPAQLPAWLDTRQLIYSHNPTLFKKTKMYLTSLPTF